MTATDTNTRAGRSGDEAWTRSMERVAAATPLVAPTLMLAASLLIAADIDRLPGDLDWASEPEGLLGLLAAVFFVATWAVVGRRIARAAPRTGVAITCLGVIGAVGWSYPFSLRLISANLVDAGFDPNAVNDAWENEGTIYTVLAFFVMAWGVLVPPIAGIAVLRTRIAPIWAGLALLAFPFVFVTAQAAYVAIEITYPAACALLLVGVAGVVYSGQSRFQPGMAQ